MTGRRSLAGKSIGGIAVIALLGFYAVARPIVNERMGWDLPELRQGSDGQVAVVDTKADSGPKTSASKSNREDFTSTAKGAGTAKGKSTDAKRSASTNPGASRPGTSAKAKGPLADRMRPSGTSSSNPTTSQTKTLPGNSSGKQTNQDDRDDDLLYGILKEVGSKRYVSPAGLLYTPGSAEGHRLEHLRRHTKDQPSRPGSHGVFDGDMAGALKTIDRAYERAKKGQRTTKSTDDGRTIYTVDMGSRVGFVGGRDGGRKRKPMARRVRIVLEGNRVITAYPM